MRTAGLVEQLKAAKSLPPGCFGVSGNVAKEAAALIERYEEAITAIEEWHGKAKDALSELQRELDGAYPEIRKALGPNAGFAHTMNSRVVRVGGKLSQIGFILEALSKAHHTGG
jgi:ABC-type transporter Mla subunit MlaD